MKTQILTGNSLEVLKTLEANSIDAIVTDPPYGLKFMGKRWDYEVPSVELWREVLRVLKPGGHLLSFGGTRTYHRMVVNIEDAGFEIRDCIQWLYGSGFPKSHNLSKALDESAWKLWLKNNDEARRHLREIKESGSDLKLAYEKHAEQVRLYQIEAGVLGEVIGKNTNHRSLRGTTTHGDKFQPHTGDGSITAPATDAAKEWQGWGTALKPANEPIVMARKPLEAKLTVAANVLKYGTGALNIDVSRIGMQPATTCPAPDITGGAFNSDVSGRARKTISVPAQGRWPANIILDEQAASVLDIQAIQDASRFFYVAKASKSERNKGLSEGQNIHPTVKPVKLMEYLIKLITPINGIVLDPFTGSGTTGVAAAKLGIEFVGIELSPEYAEIATKRIAGVK